MYQHLYAKYRAGQLNPIHPFHTVSPFKKKRILITKMNRMFMEKKKT